jgi:hypothetical protein
MIRKWTLHMSVDKVCVELVVHRKKSSLKDSSTSFHYLSTDQRCTATTVSTKVTGKIVMDHFNCTKRRG